MKTTISLDTNIGPHRPKKFDCPYCGHKKRWVRYINPQTLEYYPMQFGRCDREVNCGAHHRPKRQPAKHVAGVKYRINPNLAIRSQRGYRQTNFFKWFAGEFGHLAAVNTFEKYGVGYAKRYGGSAVFWYKDIAGECRSGKIMAYDLQGHRIKGQQNWVHSVMDIPGFEFQRCLFGEHLLAEVLPGLAEDIPVFLFESEKTAMIYDCAVGGGICLATGSSNGIGGKSLNRLVVRELRGKEVVLFPDSSGEDKIKKQWQNLAEQMNEEGMVATVIDWDDVLLPGHKELGLDVADWILWEKGGTFEQALIQSDNPNKAFYMPF